MQVGVDAHARKLGMGAQDGVGGAACAQHAGCE